MTREEQIAFMEGQKDRFSRYSDEWQAVRLEERHREAMRATFGPSAYQLLNFGPELD